MPDLADKIAIVTGSASGIGAATLKRLNADGAKVVGTDVQDNLGRQVAEEAGADFLTQDVSDGDAWPGIVDTVRDRYGRLDILVNNAGITTGASIEDVDMETWNRVIGVNLTGVMMGCKEAIRAMKTNPDGAGGAIINIASTTAYTPLPGDVGYSASKSGVRILTKSVATHCAQRGYAIRCNAVIPGATDTGMFKAVDEIDPELRQRVAATSPLNRIGEPAEIAAAVAFLASEECPFMTGAEMMVDGAALAIHPGF